MYFCSMLFTLASIGINVIYLKGSISGHYSVISGM